MSFDIKSSIISAGENNTDHIAAINTIADGYICEIAMPMHQVATTTQFFSAIMRKKTINSILEDDDDE